MGTAAFEIARAKALLAKAEEAERTARRAELVSDLKSTRATLRVKQRELEKLGRQVFKGQSALDNWRAEHRVVSDALATYQSRKPDVADYLPDDPETVQWRNQCAALEAELERLRLQRTALPNVELLRVEAVNLTHHIQQLSYAEINTLSALDGSLGQSPAGGISAPR